MATRIEEQSKFLSGVAAAQFMAFLAACAGLEIELMGDDARPMVTVSICYGLLALVHGSYLFYRQGGRLNIAWWKYALLAFNDVAAAYCALLSLRFTTVPSWALLQPSQFLTVVPLSIILLKASYTWKHLVSGLLTFSGLVLLLLADANGEDDDSSRSTLDIVIGDLIAVLGALLYGINNVAVETMTKGAAPTYEVIGMIGSFGTVYSVLAAFVLGEFSADTFPETKDAIYTFTAGVANFVFYSLMVVVLCNSGAAVLTISLLGINFWSILGKLIIIGGFHTNVIGFVFAVMLVISGVTLFTLSGSPYAKNTEEHVPLCPEIADTGDKETAEPSPTEEHAPSTQNLSCAN